MVGVTAVGVPERTPNEIYVPDDQHFDRSRNFESSSVISFWGIKKQKEHFKKGQTFVMDSQFTDRKYQHLHYSKGSYTTAQSACYRRALPVPIMEDYDSAMQAAYRETMMQLEAVMPGRRTRP
eukprot:883200-Prorocentrum_minimum.AAC.5